MPPPTGTPIGTPYVPPEERMALAMDWSRPKKSSPDDAELLLGAGAEDDDDADDAGAGIGRLLAMLAILPTIASVESLVARSSVNVMSLILLPMSAFCWLMLSATCAATRSLAAPSGMLGVPNRPPSVVWPPVA